MEKRHYIGKRIRNRMKKVLEGRVCSGRQLKCDGCGRVGGAKIMDSSGKSVGGVTIKRVDLEGMDAVYLCQECEVK